MVIKLPHIENSSLTHYIPPKGAFTRFRDDTHYEEMVRLWELSTTKLVKKEFWFKGKQYQRLVQIIGYETYGVTEEFHTLIIEFQDGNRTCIHPPYLKEMQTANFGKESNERENVPSAELKKASTPKPPKPKKEATPKIELPLDKVHFTAKVKQFAYMWNPFNEENDEVVVLEEVVMATEPSMPLGLVWCSHSKTLKKFELHIGDVVEFDGKVVKKTLSKGKDVEEAFVVQEKVPYKINNPSKIEKK